MPNTTIPTGRTAADRTRGAAGALRQLEREPRPLEPGASRRRRLRKRWSPRPSASWEDRDLKGYDDEGGTRSGLLAAPICEHGIPLARRSPARAGGGAARGQPASGGHLAYIPGGGLYHSALGDYLAAVTNKYAGIFFTGPGPVRMENMLVRWVADLVGYPRGAAGNIASGGSIANLTAIATARDAHGLKGADYAARGGLPDHPGPPQHREGAAHRRAGRGAGAARGDGRALPHAARGAGGGHRGRPRGGAPPLAGGRGRGHDRHRRRGPARRHRRRRRARGLLVPRGRGVRRLLPADRARAAGAARDRAVRLGRCSTRTRASSCRTAPASWWSATPRRSPPRTATPATTCRTRCASPARSPRRRVARADQAFPRAPHVAAADAGGHPALPRGAGGEAAARPLLPREIEALGFEVGPQPDLSIVTYRWAPPGVGPERRTG